MDFLILAIAILASFHAYTYIKVLRRQQNKLGVAGVTIIILTSLALPVYRIFKSP